MNVWNVEFIVYLGLPEIVENGIQEDRHVVRDEDISGLAIIYVQMNIVLAIWKQIVLEIKDNNNTLLMNSLVIERGEQYDARASEFRVYGDDDIENNLDNPEAKAKGMDMNVKGGKASYKAKIINLLPKELVQCHTKKKCLKATENCIFGNQDLMKWLLCFQA